ncbi:SNARE Bet1 [Schizosaccharomyces japonicus yFS275]|uniref:SNARE Bet1 n=1 Tax=Schizosaccharomyces japonicus (strain yFS275 / FY16936) TaxID=402676 RepID=B6JZQ8_SCHJY|nr:SNARE Bet1 [Schizosaccharomyces japonicus yFS275]EEB07026.1 SNARE Bet1 [Schizosaccharomyces japonicus yFS275]
MANRFGRKDKVDTALPLYETRQSPSSPFLGRSSFGDDELESRNNGRIEGLTGKVQSLKHITMAIGHEINSSTNLMESMNDSFSSTHNVVSTTMLKLKNLSQRHGISIWTWLLFFCCVALVFVWVRY